MILVRFVPKESKCTVLQKTKSLRDHDDTRNIYIGDDLTPLRVKLLKKARRLVNCALFTSKTALYEG